MNLMSLEKSKKRRWVRFSLATFLFLALCIGGLIGGYQAGYHRGYNGGQALRIDQTQRSETYSTVLVIGTDLNTEERTAAVTDLSNLITSTIQSGVWSPQSGNQICDFPTNHTLVITAPGYVQREVRELFAQLENLITRDSIDDLLPALQGLASQGKTFDQIVPINQKPGAAGNEFVERYFNSTVRGLSKNWGDPAFQGKCQDTGFPLWSLDQQLATWPRGNGVAYVALRVTTGGQLQIVSGYRAKS
jgi:hypothetical protein